jgi:GNAT superfamily N-acetyltransferase
MTETRVLIRQAVAADVEGIMTTHLSAIAEICSSAYPPDEISAWLSGGRNPDRYLPGIAEGHFLVALLDDAFAGFCDFDLGAGEVGGMFVAPAHVRRGVGRALLQTVEVRAREQGVRRLGLRATLNAIGFYQAQGFVVDEMSLFRLRSGVELSCAVMHKELNHAGTG